MKERKLTLKQARLIENYTNPDSPTFGNKTKSGLRAGYKNERTGRSELLKSKLKEKVEMILDKMGYTDKKLLKRLSDITFNYNATAKDRTNALQGLRLLFELTDTFPSKKEEVKVEEVGSLNEKDIQELKEILKKGLRHSKN